MAGRILIRSAIVALILLALPTPALAAITFFGVAADPTDPGTTNASPIDVTPPASMVAGDLAVAFLSSSNPSLSFAVSAAGGQSWTDLGCSNVSATTLCVFWARFDGTWDTDPSWERTGTGNSQVVLLVFRPTSGTNTWAVDNALAHVVESANTVYTIGSVTRGGASSVAIGYWAGDEGTASTWGTLTGTGWSKTGLSAQYRNTNGNDLGVSLAYNIGSGGTNAASQTQSQSVVGRTAIVSFAESAVASGCRTFTALLGVGCR